MWYTDMCFTQWNQLLESIDNMVSHPIMSSVHADHHYQQQQQQQQQNQQHHFLQPPATQTSQLSHIQVRTDNSVDALMKAPASSASPAISHHQNQPISSSSASLVGNTTTKNTATGMNTAGRRTLGRGKNKTRTPTASVKQTAPVSACRSH